mmetsp:Transcript_27736/g.20828  ORF Transcript_27736/g.20828 Transcript_27736/m.20828 type:complete len:142 (-) Transcript_27736:9-434(-)
MERPNANNRWDQPLFHLLEDTVTPLEEIFVAVTSGKKPRDPVSTKQEQMFDQDFIYELDKHCQQIVNFIIMKQSEANIGDVLGVPNCFKEKYKMTKICSPIELKKLKSEFLNFSKLHPPKSKDQFGDSFLQFLNSSLANYL